jgi:drug/metabolite transporter (DMT)-like permease
LYSELLSPFLWIGIGLSILSIFLITSSKSTEKKTNSTAFWYILIIWLGSGIVDSIIKITTIQAGSLKDWVSDGIYQSCMIFSIIYLLYLLLFKKKKLHWTSIGLGLILGFINYFSLYAFVQSNALRNIAASVFFPINNMGIIIFTSLFSVLLFKEELGKKALWGLGLGILGILAILYHAL